MIVDALKDRDVVVGTTGMLSRELFEYRVAKGHGHEKDFLTVGSMGHASAIALGIAQFRPKRQVLANSILYIALIFTCDEQYMYPGLEIMSFKQIKISFSICPSCLLVKMAKAASFVTKLRNVAFTA